MSIILPGVQTIISAPRFSSAIWIKNKTVETEEKREKSEVSGIDNNDDFWAFWSLSESWKGQALNSLNLNQFEIVTNTQGTNSSRD